MKRHSVWIGGVVISVLALALGYGAWRMLQGQGRLVCEACSRPLHSHAQVVGLVGNERKEFCCPACALADHRQTGQSVRVIELTDYASEKPLSPESAYLVVGSNVNHCLHAKPLVNESKEASHLEFDRCSPSILAFAGEQGARAFMAENGGRLATFAELAGAFH